MCRFFLRDQYCQGLTSMSSHHWKQRSFSGAGPCCLRLCTDRLGTIGHREVLQVQVLAAHGALVALHLRSGTCHCLCCPCLAHITQCYIVTAYQQQSFMEARIMSLLPMVPLLRCTWGAAPAIVSATLAWHATQCCEPLDSNAVLESE